MWSDVILYFVFVKQRMDNNIMPPGPSGTKVYYPTYFATPSSMLAKCIGTILDMQPNKTYLSHMLGRILASR